MEKRMIAAADGRGETDGDETAEHSLALIPLPRTARQGNGGKGIESTELGDFRTSRD
jgi:hypothetical protein